MQSCSIKKATSCGQLLDQLSTTTQLHWYDIVQDTNIFTRQIICNTLYIIIIQVLVLASCNVIIGAWTLYFCDRCWTPRHAPNLVIFDWELVCWNYDSYYRTRSRNWCKVYYAMLSMQAGLGWDGTLANNNIGTAIPYPWTMGVHVYTTQASTSCHGI